MKRISILLITIFIVFSCADNKEQTAKPEHKTTTETNVHDTNGIVWHTNLEEAIKIAEKESKPILLQFSGSDWCHWCIKLNEEVMEKKGFIDYAKDNMVLVNLDFPRNTPQTDEIKKYNRTLAEKYGIKGFPTILLLDKTGKVVHQTGYQAGGPLAYIKHIKDAYSSK